MASANHYGWSPCVGADNAVSALTYRDMWWVRSACGRLAAVHPLWQSAHVPRLDTGLALGRYPAGLEIARLRELVLLLERPAHFGDEFGVGFEADGILQVGLRPGGAAGVVIRQRAERESPRVAVVELDGAAEFRDGALEVAEVVIGEPALEVERRRIRCRRRAGVGSSALRIASVQRVVREWVTGVRIGKE